MNSKKSIDEVEKLFNGSHIEAGLTPVEKSNEALIKLLSPNYGTNRIPPFKSLPEAYIHFTGDRDFRGAFHPNMISNELRNCQDLTSSSFQFALSTAFNQYVATRYNDIPAREEVLISQKQKTRDFRECHTIKLNCFQDLPEVDPEAEDYASLNASIDSELQYNILTRGGIMWVTRRVIMNDSINLIKTLLAAIAHAARRTHAKYVWNFYLNNAICPDGTAWFTNVHGNLSSDALNFTPLVSAVKALANMLESGSNEKYGLDLASFQWNLIVSIDMWDLAVKMNQTRSYFTSNNLTSEVTNPCYRLFGEKNERIITCPFQSSIDDDWGLVRNPEELPIIEMSYLNGQETPEFIIAENRDYEKYGKSDCYGYKVRHEYGGVLTEYKCGYKSIIP